MQWVLPILIVLIWCILCGQMIHELVKKRWAGAVITFVILLFWTFIWRPTYINLWNAITGLFKSEAPAAFILPM